MLIAEARAGIELIEHIPPFVRRIEGRMDHREITDLADKFQTIQPEEIFGQELGAGVGNALISETRDIARVAAHAREFIVISFHRRAFERTHDVEAFLGIRVVADDIPEADVMRDVMRFRVREDGGERLEI